MASSVTDKSIKDELFIGMYSGTCQYSVDAVLVNFSRGSMDILHALSTAYPPAIRATLEQLLESVDDPPAALADLLDENLGRFFARIAQNLVREAGMEMHDIRAIGSSGQNVRNRCSGAEPVIMHLGKGQLMAKNTSTTVVNNFSTEDVKAGGGGARLAPLLHRHLFHSRNEDRAVLTVGGISSLTLLPVNGDATGFDCGPGNYLLDAWTRAHLHKDYDDGGQWARKGTLDCRLLERLLDDPYFRTPPPKSTGLEAFSMNGLERALSGDRLKPMDVQTTLVELVAASVARALEFFTRPKRLLVCGGGVHNAYLMRRLAARLPDSIVESTARYGADPDWVDGMLFAWLARERLKRSARDASHITGAGRPVLLGDVYEP